MQFEIVPFYTVEGTLAWVVKLHTHEVVAECVKVKRKLLPDYFKNEWVKKEVFYLLGKTGYTSSSYYLRNATLNSSYLSADVAYVYDSQEKAKEAIEKYVNNSIKVNSGIPIECLQK